MYEDTIIYPDYFRILKCRLGRWFITNPQVFVGFKKTNIDDNDIATLFGITEQEVVINLFRINGAKSGYYLANLRDKKYYYCGQSREDLKAKLRSLGIGRDDPLD